MNHEFYMQMALELALKGAGLVSPNPMVGCVIIKENIIISTGYHKKVGELHAEADAIKNASESVEGATLYCNLEPCCHTNKRTPPCAQSIIKAGIKKVVICNLDPNPYVAGKGVQLLEKAGIEVITGVLKDKGLKLNEIFFTHITQKKAHVLIKMAQTLDGKIATIKGHSKWITSSSARLDVHAERLKYDSILVGAQTARIDNPSLTVRLNNYITPKKRLILSSNGDFPKDLKLFSDEFNSLSWIVVPTGTKPVLNHQYINCPMLSDGTFNLNALSKIVYEKLNICSIYVEGGSSIHTQFIKQNAYDRIHIYIAPKLVGTGKEVIGDIKVNLINEAIKFKNFSWKMVGDDLLFSAINEEKCLQD